MKTLELHEPTLADEVYLLASREGMQPSDILEAAVRNYLHDYAVKKISQESDIWYGLPSDVRNQYKGRFVAVYDGEIVDNDPDRIVLYKRIRAKYGRQPVLLVEGGDHPMPEYRITNINAARSAFDTLCTIC